MAAAAAAAGRNKRDSKLAVAALVRDLPLPSAIASTSSSSGRLRPEGSVGRRKGRKEKNEGALWKRKGGGRGGKGSFPFYPRQQLH